MDAILTVYINMIEYCLPFCVVFGFGNMIISSVMRAIFGGKLVIR